MIIVTGGAGFIGSNIVKGLNDIGESDIIVVDNLVNTEKIKNLSGLSIVDYMDKQEFYEAMLSGTGFGRVSAVLHQGACSDTMATDGRYVLHNNFTYSKALMHFCVKNKAQFLYASSASVYGAGTIFKEHREHESALNAYAYSKLLFDNYIRAQKGPPIQCVGLRYFNVYGPREQHKDRMASVAWHFRNQILADGKVKIFQGSDGYADGEQRRDFVSVEDIVKINIFFMQHPDKSGIYNAGTGKCQSFNDVAVSVINSLGQDKQDPLTLEGAINQGKIQYVPMPAALHGKYQSFTEANLDHLHSCGYEQPFLTVQQGVSRYMDYLNKNS